MRDAIHLLKYQGHARIGTWLGKEMARVCNHLGDGCVDCVLVPVPLSVERLREREFNQSLMLAKSLSKAFRLPLRPLLLERRGGSTPQVGLSPEDRWKNVRGAFGVSGVERIPGRGVILVDDVFTTGATVNECARVLKKAGARWVEVWTLARAV
ncbi:MAG: ComF family protein [bacterium]